MRFFTNSRVSRNSADINLAGLIYGCKVSGRSKQHPPVFSSYVRKSRRGAYEVGRPPGIILADRDTAAASISNCIQSPWNSLSGRVPRRRHRPFRFFRVAFSRPPKFIIGVAALTRPNDLRSGPRCAPRRRFFYRLNLFPRVATPRSTPDKRELSREATHFFRIRTKKFRAARKQLTDSAASDRVLRRINRPFFLPPFALLDFISADCDFSASYLI